LLVSQSVPAEPPATVDVPPRHVQMLAERRKMKGRANKKEEEEGGGRKRIETEGGGGGVAKGERRSEVGGREGQRGKEE
jgi:hypothetical protein